MSPQLSIVIPVYNSQVTLPHLVNRLRKVLDQQYAAYEIVLVDDGSRDQSWSILEQLKAVHGARLRIADGGNHFLPVRGVPGASTLATIGGVLAPARC